MTAQWTFETHGQPDSVEVYITDEHGCLLNTEPVCVVFAYWHPYFLAWLKEQPCPYEGTLLWHPMLGETMESYLENTDG